MTLTLAAGIPGARAETGDAWVLVASGGLGDQGRVQVDALEIHGGQVYAATHDGSGAPAILRASLTSDATWVDVTPARWSPATGEVKDLLSWEASLWAGTEGGQLWRLRPDGRWTDESPEWTAGRPIFGLAAWTPPGEGGERLVVACRGVRLRWRRSDGAWEPMGLPGDLVIHPFQSGALATHGGHLYLGAGAGSAGSATAQLWRFGGTTVPVTLDGFGRPEISWVTDLVEFGGMLYVGTGGHGSSAGVFRMRSALPEEASPCDIYPCGTGFQPLRYRLAAAAGRLFAGTRTPYLAGDFTADVVATADGVSWVASNPLDFGNSANEGVAAMEGSGPHLFASTVNPAEGFEIWRRTPLLSEMLPYLAGELDLLVGRTPRALRCIRTPGCRSWRRLLRPVDELRLLFETARHPDDDALLLDWARTQMADARGLVGEAGKLVVRASHAAREKRARHLRAMAAGRVSDAVDIAAEACRKAGVPLPQ